MEYKKEPIYGYPEYSVDTNGVVYSKRDKPLSYSCNAGGYPMVTLLYNQHRQTIAIHRLVALQFLPKAQAQEELEVNHIDGNKLNNCVDNLEWVTHTQNVRHCIDSLHKNVSSAHHNSRSIEGIDMDSSQIRYAGDCIADIAKLIAEQEGIKVKSALSGIWRALSGVRKSYRHCYWRYTDI